MKYVTLAMLAGLCAISAQAATPADLLADYRAAAGSNFTPSAQRGAAFFANRFGKSAKMPACTSCHTDDPGQAGRHVVTDKTIKPLAPSVNAARFTDAAKTEKWFRRNCTEVVGRECNAGEKADFVAFMMGGR